MLVLSRKESEKILVGNDVRITVIRVTPKSVRIGIEAPADMPILREELRTDDRGLVPGPQSGVPAKMEEAVFSAK